MAEPVLVTTIATMRDHVAAARAAGRRVALVPTMGALHEGHLALVRAAAEHADEVIVSIFVNPLQFGQGEDLDRYPRTQETDLASLGSLDVEVGAVFAPSALEMYPRGAIETRVHAGPVGETFEGAARPGHFDGVLTVVTKLFSIVQPDVAVFGAKDAQQVFLVRQLIADLNLPVRLIEVDTVREADGLALSSRNRFLSEAERRAALALATALAAIATAIPRGLTAARDAGAEVLEDAAGVDLDYLELVDPETFRTPVAGHRGAVRAIVAARVGATRLIDTALIERGLSRE